MKKPLTVEEQEDLCLACRDSIDRLLVYGLVDTGIRLREWCDIDGWRVLDAAKTSSGVISIGKANNARQVPMSKRFLKLAVKYFTDNPVGSGMPLATRASEYRLRELEKLAKLKSRVTPATLRLTFVMNALQKSVDERSIRAALGSWPSTIKNLCEKYAKTIKSPVSAFKESGW